MNHRLQTFCMQAHRFIIEFHQGGPRGRVGKVAEFQRSYSFEYLTAVTGVGSSPTLASCETRQVLLAGVSGNFPGILRFRPTYRLARLDMSEIILKGKLN